MKVNSILPCVSVIIPTYNRAHMVGRAIKSVINQTAEDWELLIVDDGSTDDTDKVVQGFADPRIRYIRLEGNNGASRARNAGIREARGEYLAPLDSDDEWLPEKLERQLEIFRKDRTGSLGVVLCDVVIEYANGVLATKSLPLRGWVYEDLLARRFNVPKLTFMLKRSVFGLDIAFDESFEASEDTDFLIGLAEIARFDYVSEPLVKVHRHSGSHVQAGINAITGLEQLLEKYRVELNQRPRVLAQYHLNLAIAHWKFGDRHVVKALQASPKTPSLYVNVLSAVCVRWLIKFFLKLRNLPSVIREEA